MNAAHAVPPHTLSIVVPFYNEEDNIAPLVRRVHEALVGYENPWELVLVDDGSSDATIERALQSAKEYGPHVRVVELTRNFKQDNFLLLIKAETARLACRFDFFDNN